MCSSLDLTQWVFWPLSEPPIFAVQLGVPPSAWCLYNFVYAAWVWSSTDVVGKCWKIVFELFLPPKVDLF